MRTLYFIFSLPLRVVRTVRLFYRLNRCYRRWQKIGASTGRNGVFLP